MRLHDLPGLVALLALMACAPAMAAQKLLVASWRKDCIFAYDPITGAPLGTFIPAGSGGTYQPDEMVVGPDGDVYISPYSFQNAAGGNRIYHYRGDTGAFVGTMTAAQLSGPRGLAFGSDGKLYVSSADTNSILKFDPGTGAFLGVFATASTPIGLAFGPDGNLYVANAGVPGSIQRIDGATGASLGTFTSSLLDNPQALVFGPDHMLYVHSQYNYKILKFDAAAGTLAGTFFNGAYPYNPSAGMVWGPDGKLYTGNLTNGAANDGVWRFNSGGGLDTYFIGGDGNFSATGVAFTAVPEPTTLVLSCIVGTLLVFRRPNKSKSTGNWGR
jgi:outer membrane protein assembly factor BamB